MLKNKCCLYVVISIRFFSITICNLLIEFPSYYVAVNMKNICEQSYVKLTTVYLRLYRFLKLPKSGIFAAKEILIPKSKNMIF